MDAIGRMLRPPSLKSVKEGAKSLFIPHFIVNLFLSTSFFIVKTLPPICDVLFEDCSLELKQWEWLTFLGCVIVLKNRKQGTFQYRVNTSSFSKQLPTLILFQDGKEKMRRPAMSGKGTVVKYVFTKQNIINDFELNEVYSQCKKVLPKAKKDKDVQQEKKEN
ncbi:thioredoxin-related transmembrane protein 2-B-like [Ruditapes philippinarum]|uniref:thioredoxin-related transmembrane protein 2-B-like n=1 Tax=Ruditapes philippinarum TaxID=129788 RepID=UPI00295B22BB|nr:thioredoxin-related transmembrane protein 2-B-like [Ruditapes philippinarum]